MEMDPRVAALALARGRVVAGLTMLVVPGLVARVLIGDRSATTKALVRMIGIRDLALGLGAITTTKEHSADAEWVSMGALADAGDAIALFLAPGSSVRRLRNTFVAASAAAAGLASARALADERVASPTSS
ncbi:MAG: hypothetical protein ACT4OX_14095 [Actinomycetota bacterium]